MTDTTKEKEKIKFNIVSANWKAQQEWGMAYNTSTTSQAFIENREISTFNRNLLTNHKASFKKFLKDDADDTQKILHNLINPNKD